MEHGIVSNPNHLAPYERNEWPVKCKCGLNAQVVKASVGLDCGRQFYSCRKPLYAEDFCNFQVFIDPQPDLSTVCHILQLQRANDQLRQVVIQQWEYIDLLLMGVEDSTETETFVASTSSVSVSSVPKEVTVQSPDPLTLKL